MSGLLSVIVPVYNMEKYIRECVGSILGQTYEEIELILVDDGSADTSGRICDEYAKRDSRVKVIHQKHEGPIQARRIGVENAGGDYVTFVDSDDWIKEDTYSQLMSVRGNADLVVSGITLYYGREHRVDEMPLLDEGLYERPAVEGHIIPRMLWGRGKNHWELNPSLCTKLFKRELIAKHLKKAAKLGIHYGEDVAVVYPMILETQSIYVLHRCFYFHRQWREGTEALPYIQKDPEYFTKLYRLYGYLRSEFENSRFCDVLLNQLDHFYINAVNLKQQYFSDYHEVSRDAFPFWIVARDSKVVLYGAGDLGEEYFRQNELYHFCEVVLWADRNFAMFQKRGKDIADPEKIGTVDFDYLLIAVKSIELAQQIRDDLLNKGIPKQKMIWSGIKSVELE